VIPALIVALPVGVGVYSALIARSLIAVNVALASAALCVAGALLRRYSLVVAGVWVAILNYLGALLSSGRGVEIWPSLLVGIAAFLLLEVSHDWISVVRAVVGWRTYSMRARSMTRTAVIASAATFVMVTVALNGAAYLSVRVELHVAALAAVGVVGAVVVPVVYLLRRDGGEEPE